MKSDKKGNKIEERRELEHCALNKDLFLQKPISTDNLVREIKKKISST